MSMMGMGVGLNDEAKNELKPTAGITEPTEINADNGITIIVDTKTDLPDPAAEGVVTNFDDFNIIVETHEGLETERVRLEDVAQLVMAQETISYSDVQNFLKAVDITTTADEKERIVVGGMAARLDARAPLDSYTEAPSTANLAETKKFFQKELNVNREAIHALYNDFFMNKCDDFLKRAGWLVKMFENEISAQEEWATVCLGFQANSASSKNYLAYMVVEEGEPGKRTQERKLYDIRHFPLSDWRFKDVIEMGVGVCSSLFKVLSDFMRGTEGQDFCRTARRHVGDLSMSSPYYKTILEIIRQNYPDNDSYAPGLTYAELLGFASSGTMASTLSEMKLYLEKEMEVVAGMQQACKENKPFVYEGKEFNFQEAASRVIALLRGVCQSAEFVSTAETVRSLCLPVFNAMNEVLVQK